MAFTYSVWMPTARKHEWQECERCYKARLDRRMARAQARKGAA